MSEREAFARAISAASLCLHLGENAGDLHLNLGDLNLEDEHLLDAAEHFRSFAALSFIESMVALETAERYEAAEQAYRLFALPKPDLYPV